MFHKREKFERIDVPTPSRARDIVAAGVLVVVFIALAIGVSAAWRKAQSYGGFSSKTIEEAIDSQPKPEPVSGATASTDDFTTCLFLTVSKDGTALDGVRVIALDTTAGTTAVADIPLDLTVSTESGTTTLTALCSSSGPVSCIVPASTALAIRFDHAFIVRDSFWPALQAYCAAQDKKDGTAVREAAQSDISSRKVDAFFDKLAAAGVETAIQAPIDYPSSTTGGGDTPTSSTLDAAQLNIALGLYTAA